MGFQRVRTVSADTPSAILAFIDTNHLLTLTEPDGDLYRYFEYDYFECNGIRNRKGILLGSIRQTDDHGNYVLEFPDVEVGSTLGIINFFDHRNENNISFSVAFFGPVTSIMTVVGSQIEENQVESGYRTKRLRIMPRNPEDIRKNDRVRVLGMDKWNFTIVLAKLLPNEGVCWRCSSIAKDLDHALRRCPVCGLDFNGLAVEKG